MLLSHRMQRKSEAVMSGPSAEDSCWLYLSDTLLFVGVGLLLYTQPLEGVVQIIPNVRLFRRLCLLLSVHRREGFRQHTTLKMAIDNIFVISPRSQELIAKPTRPPIRTVQIESPP